IARPLAPPRDQRFEIRQEVRYGLVAARGHFGRYDWFERTKDRQRPVAQRRALVMGDVEQIADDLDRDGRGEILDQLATSLGSDGVEQPVDQLDDVALHAGDRAWRQRAHDQAAYAGMRGRIVEDEARGVVLVERRIAIFRCELALLVRAERLGVL